MITKKVYLPLLSAVIIGGAAIGVTQVHAQSANGPFSGLAAVIAQKFNLDQTQVQSTIDQFATDKRNQMQQQMDQREQDRLTKLVQDGKITDAQKQAILTELAALKTKYNPTALKSLTPDQRQAQFTAEQAEIKAWATANNIDLQYLRMGFGVRRGMWQHGQMPKPSSTPSS